ncbi:hypothetical protein [Algivirga pacifica]|uniref:Lipoprotein n=1 Tax=Algivirga pacifica TaxID=1162670 RepID=A0ABP9DDF4_9BACT
MILVLLLSCSERKSNRQALLEKFNIDRGSQSITFPEVKSIYNTQFEDEDTVFVFLKEDIYYYQQGVKYLLGKWYYKKDMLCFDKICDYREQTYPIFSKNMLVGKEGIMHDAELNYNVLGKVSSNINDTTYQIISTETYNPSLYFDLDYSILDLSVRKGVLNLKTFTSKSKHSSTAYFDISWCNQMSESTCDCIFLLDAKKDYCE